MAANVERKPGETHQSRQYRRRVEGSLGNVAAVAYFPEAEPQSVDAKRRPKQGSVELDRTRGRPVELLIRRSERRCLSCGDQLRKPKKDEQTGRVRRVDHCQRCEREGQATTWGRSQNEAINHFLMKVTPLILKGKVRNRARERRARRS